MKNYLFLIKPYKFNNQWVFDDEKLDLSREPFMSGIPKMIDILTEDIPQADSGFTLFFSDQPFPGYEASLDWLREEYGGNWYKWEEKALEGWLCPAMYLFFASPPQNIYCSAKTIS